jgi:2,3-bisphosphoglycerate-dependent phosphoglycerate mutase
MIYVMRHGESIVNVQRRLTCRLYDGDLSPLGREQASKAALWFADKALSRIVYSPFHRAQQTAEIVGAQVGVAPVMDERLCEMDCGNLEGRTGEDAWAIWASVYERWLMADWEAAFPEGETYRNAYTRYKACLDSMRAAGNVLLVTHGGITNTVLPYLCVNAAALQVRHLDNTGIITLEPEPMTGQYICWSWNLVEHLTTP